MKKYLALLTFVAIIGSSSLLMYTKEVTAKSEIKKTASVKEVPTGTMKVTILPGCLGCGKCNSISSEVFSMNDVAHVNQSKVAGNEQKCRKAAQACPAHVIKIEII